MIRAIFVVLGASVIAICHCTNEDDRAKSAGNTDGIVKHASEMLQVPNSPYLTYMLVPALTLAGILPWILPGLRMAVGVVQMVNQMAFMGGLTALVRSYIFDARPDEHVIYLNHGYGHKVDNHHEPVNHQILSR